MDNKGAHKSRFRGVYRCGKRWKAQLQSHGVQFYLGMFDTEEEAALAYDRKAKEEKGGKSISNFEINLGVERMFMDDSGYGDGTFEEQYEDSRRVGNKHGRAGDSVDHISGGVQQRRLDYQSTTLNLSVLWDRYSQISQRLLLAKAAQTKLAELQISAPDVEKEKLLQALGEEVNLLVVVKAQIEECISRCFLMGLSVNTINTTGATSSATHAEVFGPISASASSSSSSSSSSNKHDSEGSGAGGESSSSSSNSSSSSSSSSCRDHATVATASMHTSGSGSGSSYHESTAGINGTSSSSSSSSNSSSFREVCPICQQRFPDAIALVTHFEASHPGQQQQQQQGSGGSGASNRDGCWLC